jgi:pilus assembly protein CpaC
MGGTTITAGAIRIGAACLFGGLLALAGPVVAKTSDITIFRGQEKIMSVPGVTRIAVGNGKVLSVSVVGKGQVLLLAEAPGMTSIHFWTKSGRESDYKINVLATDVARVLQDVNGMLRGVKNVSARIVGDKIVLEGDNVSDETQDKLKKIVKIYPQAVNFVGKVGWEKMIHMDVKIVEFRKSALEKLGIDWQNSITGPTFATVGDFHSNNLFRGNTPPATWNSNGAAVTLPLNVNPFKTYFGLVTEITSRLNFMVSTGDAFTLAEPKLSCRSGGEAKFLAGGEIPIPVQTALGQTQVIFKQYGILLDIKPVADDTGTIFAKIKTEVSAIDPSVTVLSVPGFLTRRTETEINVRQGETLVISGLLNSDASKDVSKIAGLGDLPVLGNLFRSHDFKNKKTELVVFITPRIVTAGSPANRAELRRTEKRLQASQKKFEARVIE